MRRFLVPFPAFVILVVVIFLAGACAGDQERGGAQEKNVQTADIAQAIEDDGGDKDVVVGNLVDPSKLVSGGPPKDGIPSIDDPVFVSVAASDWIRDDADVFILSGNKTVKIYPQQILVWHEIVNDAHDGLPVVVTYCPLCGSSVAYERTVGGETTTFGTTGKLYLSNLVMYDRATDSYWTQIRGEAIIGERAGSVLKKVLLQTMRWKDAKASFPDALVLSKKTGFSRSYGSDPYGGYYTSDSIYFPVGRTDARLDAKAIVIGVNIDDEVKAYPEFLLKEKGTLDDEVGGVPLRLVMDEDGFLKIRNRDTDEALAWERDFWFAWYAFHPDTQLYE